MTVVHHFTVEVFGKDGLPMTRKEAGVEFSVQHGTISNSHDLLFVAGRTATATEVALSRRDKVVFRMPLTAPRALMAKGTLHFQPGGISLRGEGEPSLLHWAVAMRDEPAMSLAEFVKNNPEASLQEVWEAAFVAGARVTHILLTGDEP